MKTWPTISERTWGVFLVLGVLTIGADAAERPVLTVGKQGAQYTAIQAAIDAAPEGATIRIGPGNFVGGIKIEKPLTLEGEGWDRTTVLAPQLSTYEKATREEMEHVVREAIRQVEQAKTPEERNAVKQAFRDRWSNATSSLVSTRGSSAVRSMLRARRRRP